MKRAVNVEQGNVQDSQSCWGIVGRGVGCFFRILLMLGLVAVLVQPVYFAWRASRPMELPEFGGRTFYQILAERQQAYAEHEEAWQLTHDGEYPLGARNMCFLLETWVVIIEPPLLDRLLILHIRHPGEPYYGLPADVRYQNIGDFLPATWALFEMLTLNLYQLVPNGPGAAWGPHHGSCIIPPPFYDRHKMGQ